MAPTNKLPKEIEKRREILSTALEIFVQEGYFAATGASIAKATDISEDQLFSYFETKEDLLHTIVDEAVHILFDGLDPNEDGDLLEVELLFFINDYFDSTEKNLKFFKLFYALRWQPGVLPLYQQELDKIVSMKFDVLNEYFSKSGAADPEMETEFLTSMLDGIAMNYVLEPEGYPIDAMQQKILNMYITKAEYEE
ncbi:TetR/AcrR family transcriptional regulator [Marinifilum caeruleilacunae]|uniref:TetR/AcrR family transcriptional regulator n=1 Tax=Marinifilum caeruleilacunae TaxID=2499076 RepID=A0ABX1WVK1_9BACT|nr:TetR/AcrR family transcriptional regulator [Marinifilum caeruleilacunae]NOU60131.1 TetR/AcrR family transcriptional regulator [Marinifilum caeruleilacunae]